MHRTGLYRTGSWPHRTGPWPTEHSPGLTEQGPGAHKTDPGHTQQGPGRTAQNRALSTQNIAPGAQNRALGTRNRSLGAQNKALGAQNRELVTAFGISAMVRVSDVYNSMYTAAVVSLTNVFVSRSSPSAPLTTSTEYLLKPSLREMLPVAQPSSRCFTGGRDNSYNMMLAPNQDSLTNQCTPWSTARALP